MSNVFTLDSFREELDKSFTAVHLELPDGSDVALKSLLRLSQSARKEVIELLKELGKDKEDAEDDEDGLDAVEKLSEKSARVIEIIAGKDAKKVLKELDGDLPLMMRVIEAWMEGTQAGEAERSHD